MSTKNGYRKHSVPLLMLLSMLLLVVSLVQAEEVSNDHQVQLGEEQLNSEIELRRSIGFRSDIEYVQTVHRLDNVIVHERLGGIAFTPAEANELETRIDLEKDGDVLQAYFAQDTDLQEAFGGIYLDHAAGSEDHTVGGQLILQIVRDHEVTDRIPTSLPPLKYPERLRIEIVDFSEEHLKEQYETITNAAFQHSELQTIYINHKENRVGVTIMPSDTWTAVNDIIDKTSLPQSLATLVADPAITVRSGILQEEETSVVGGHSWGTVSGSTGKCTLGFKVWWGSNPAMLTAGHCIESTGAWAPVYNYFDHIGFTTGLWHNGGSPGFDAGLLHMNSASTASAHVLSYGNQRTVRDSTSAYVSGYWRCSTGRLSGTQCGYINCATISYQSPDNGRWYYDLFSTDPVFQQGDSGAPTFRQNADSTVSVTGIQRANLSSSAHSCLGGVDSVHSKWMHIRDHWSLTLATN